MRRADKSDSHLSSSCHGVEKSTTSDMYHSVKPTTSMVGLRDLEEINSINDALFSHNANDNNSLQTNGEPDDDDYFFVDLGEEQQVPIKGYDDHIPAEVEEKNSLTRSKPTSNTNNTYHVSNKTFKPSMKKNLSYGSLNLLADKTDPLPKSKGHSLSRSAHVRRGRPTDMKRNVSFDKLDVREYAITLGDNPAVSRGPPISLSWNYIEETSVDLEQFEATRAPRRTKGQMIMGSQVRRQILREQGGFTKSELKAATENVMKIKKERNKTIARAASLGKFDEVMESAVRKVKSIIPKSRSSSVLN